MPHILVDAEGHVIRSPETEAEIAGLRSELSDLKQREAALVAENKTLRRDVSRLKEQNDYLEKAISEIISE